MNVLREIVQYKRMKIKKSSDRAFKIKNLNAYTERDSFFFLLTYFMIFFYFFLYFFVRGKRRKIYSNWKGETNEWKMVNNLAHPYQMMKCKWLFAFNVLFVDTSQSKSIKDDQIYTNIPILYTNNLFFVIFISTAVSTMWFFYATTDESLFCTGWRHWLAAFLATQFDSNHTLDFSENGIIWNATTGFVIGDNLMFFADFLFESEKKKKIEK